MKFADSLALGWFAASGLAACLAFALDKWRAGRAGRRVSELTLLLLGAIGGWPGGLLGMMLFRHKTSKWTFQFKYALALAPFAAEVWVWFRWR